MVTLTIDNWEIQAEEGISVLQAALDCEIYIPHLCWLREMTDPPASCRLCLVEISGRNRPVTACTTPVEEGLEVFTDTETVRELQRTALKLLLSVHDVNCGNCPANRQCELQDLAKFLKVKLKPKDIPVIKPAREIDHTHPLIVYNPNRCVLCGRCIYTCREKNGHSFISFANRGFETVVSLLGTEGQTATDCAACLACVEVCPTGALTRKAK